MDIDSGATEHMSYKKDFFFNLKLLPRIAFVSLPNSQKVKVSHSGSVKLFSNLTIHNVLYEPSFCFNLLSLHKLCKQLSTMVFFTTSHCFMQGPSMKSPMLLGESQKGLYILKNRLPLLLILPIPALSLALVYVS